MSKIFPKLHNEGYKFIVIFIIVTIVLYFINGFLGFIGLVLTIWCYYFFRDPERISINDENYLTKSNWNLVKVMEDDMVGISLKKRQGIFTGYLGHSEKHNESVGTLMWNRLHISAFFGLTSFILVYLVLLVRPI